MGVRTGRSVRFQVTALATVIVAAILMATGAALLVVQRQSLVSAVDDGLRRRADDLAVLVAETVPATLPGSDDDSAAQILTSEGRVIGSSPNLRQGDAIAPDPGEREVITEVHVAGLEDSFRVLSRAVNVATGRLIVHVATATDDVSDSVEILRTSLLVVVPAAVVLLAVAIWWLVGRALRPVDAITEEVTAISERDLGRRVPVPATGDEISRLAETMNVMLDRLEDGVARLQGFAGDASHELRSPLTRIRSELEVDLANPESSDLVSTHRSVLEETVALQELVDDLLFLARSDAGKQGLRREALDLDDLVVAEAQQLRSSTPVEVDVSRVSAVQVAGDRPQLVRVVRNLGSNAARHAEGLVTFELKESTGIAVLAVTDDGPGIAPEERERIFERFARLDEARTREVGGSGLGLAIVREIVEKHGGTVTVDDTHFPGARLVVRMPVG